MRRRGIRLVGCTQRRNYSSVQFRKSRKIAIIGAGNLGFAIADGLKASGFDAKDITLTKRNAQTKMALKYQSEGFRVTEDNATAVKENNTVVIAVTPQQVDAIVPPLKEHLTKDHMVLSVVTGLSNTFIRNKLGFDRENKNFSIIRCMPNTAIAVRESMTCITPDEDAKEDDIVDCTAIFDRMGRTMIVNENQIIPATALCACGIAFFSRAIRAASQGGVEVGFHSHQAIKLAAQTALGASKILLEQGIHPEAEVDKVTTPQGITIAGLNQMEHSGFSSAFIKGIITSTTRAEKLAQDK